MSVREVKINCLKFKKTFRGNRLDEDSPVGNKADSEGSRQSSEEGRQGRLALQSH